MKLASFETAAGPSFGIPTDEGIIDLGAMLGPEVPNLASLLALGQLEHAARIAARDTAVTIPFAEVRYLPVIPNPGQIICVGLNYADHVAETGRTITKDPTLFLRVPASQTGHDRPLLCPPETTQLDFEGEIALIIGRGGRRIAEADAMAHVAGYACYNDGSARDWQAASQQWTAGKNFAGTGAFGPWMVTADEIGPDRTMTLTTRLNGEVVQQSDTDHLIHSFARLIAFISTFTPFAPGDVIVTGTPGGVGFKRTPPLFLKDGDVVEVEVDAIGILRNRVTAES